MLLTRADDVHHARRVEFGELRQFLRLEGPTAAPPAPSAGATAAAPGPIASSGDTTSTAKPSIDDFASLSLSPSELDELAREIASGSPARVRSRMYSSLLYSSPYPSNTFIGPPSAVP